MSEAIDTLGSESRHTTVRRIFVATAACTAATVIIALAWPRLVAGVIEAPVEDAVASLSGPAPVPDDMVRRALAIKEQVAAVHPTAKTWADIGLMRLREAMQLGPSTSGGRAALEASFIAHRQALSLDPGGAYAWTRLAQTLLARDGISADDLGAVLSVAVAASPYDSRLVIARVDIALAAWDHLSDPVRALMDKQIHIAADQSPTALAAAARNRFALAKVLDLLESDPILLKRFAYAYGRL